ncbi:maleylpyruvate isomerase N-terminal domain-containing protein [Streptomyces sp. NPDC091215]|uniref:maleylpyruvate isomerase N-terminal domain-containing protein n=1 Tax=Streptomyces sp. NPDC091215 TaxID=3155192 RepID=UPI0034147001
MTLRATAALASLSQSVLGLESVLDDADWAQPSACPGWTNHDLLIHLTCTFREIVEPETLPAPFQGSIERTNDVAVAAFRSEHPGRTLDAYRRLSYPALDSLAAMQTRPAAFEVVDFDDAGSHPAHLAADSLALDHYCHLRRDLTAPRGSAARFTIDADGTVMSASLAWLLAGLPQMSPLRLSSVLTRPVVLALDGPGGGNWTLVPGPDERGITAEAGTPPTAAARVGTTAESFLLWGTHRQPWRDTDLDVTGDRDLGREVLDVLHVF